MLPSSFCLSSLYFTVWCPSDWIWWVDREAIHPVKKLYYFGDIWKQGKAVYRSSDKICLRGASNWCTLETVKDAYEFQSRHSIREFGFLFLQQIGDLLLALFPTSVVHGMIVWSRWIIVCLSWGCLTEEITQILKDKMKEHICVQLNDGNSCCSHWCQLRLLCRQRVTHTIIITMKHFKNVKNILEDILVVFLVSSQRKKLNYCKVYPNWTCK